MQATPMREHPRLGWMPRLLTAILGAGLLLGTGIAVPASAADDSTNRIRYNGQEQCDGGLLIQQGRGSSTLTITGESADGQAFLAHQFATITNSFNLRGLKFTVRLDIEYVEEEMRLLSPDDPRLDGVTYVGPVYEFISHQITDVTALTADGAIIPEYTESDVRTDFVDVFDTLGDFAPGGEFLSGESSGPVPRFFDASGCDVAAAAAQV